MHTLCLGTPSEPKNRTCTVHVYNGKAILIMRYDVNKVYMCCSRAMTSILCACVVHVKFTRYEVIVGIPLIAIRGGGGGNLLSCAYLLCYSHILAVGV